MAEPISDEAALMRRIEGFERDLHELGPSIAASFAPVVSKLQETIYDLLAADYWTQVETQQHIASPGAISPTSVASSGDVSASGRVISAGIINSPGSRAYQTTVGYVSAYLDGVGDLGFAPSTRASKQDLVPWAADIDSFMGIGTTQFRYKSAVAALGDDAPQETGLVADDFVSAGLSEFTFNDPATGELAGLAYERLSVVLWSVVQQQEERIRTLEQKLSGADD